MWEILSSSEFLSVTQERTAFDSWLIEVGYEVPKVQPCLLANIFLIISLLSSHLECFIWFRFILHEYVLNNKKKEKNEKWAQCEENER